MNKGQHLGVSFYAGQDCKMYQNLLVLSLYPLDVSSDFGCASGWQVLLTVYGRSGQTAKALEVMDVMRNMGIRVDLSFVTWIATTIVQATGTYISRHSSADDFPDVLAIWMVCAVSHIHALMCPSLVHF